jgi:hypothetical protein
MKYLLQHKYRDIFKYNINFNNFFEGSYLKHIDEYLFWNKSQDELLKEIELLKATIKSIKSIDIKKYVKIRSLDDHIAPTIAKVSENLTEHIDLQRVLNSFRLNSESSKYEVVLNGYQPYSEEDATNLERYTGMIVINLDSQICFVDIKKICSITGESKSRILDELSSIKHNGASKLIKEYNSVLSSGKTHINNCSQIYEAELLMSQVYAFLPEHVHMYNDGDRLF